MRTSRPMEAELGSHKIRVKPEDKSQHVTLSLGADTAHVEHQVSGRGHGRWGLLSAAKEQLKYTQLLFPEIKYFRILVCRLWNLSLNKETLSTRESCVFMCLPPMPGHTPWCSCNDFLAGPWLLGIHTQPGWCLTLCDEYLSFSSKF